jgi:drug/metabolite transporter (DMT)-like permease
MPVLPYTFVSMLSGATIIGSMCLVTANVHPLSELSNSSMVGIIDVIYIGLFGTVAGYLLWLNGIRQLGSANASLFFNFVPVFAMLTAFLMGQPITELQLIGIIVVIIGLLLPRIVTPKRIPEPCK